MYQQGKIYKLTSHQTDDIYIGSTKDILSRRFFSHKSDYNRYIQEKDSKYLTSYELLKYEDCVIILLELYPCGSRDELRARERYYQDLLPCVNKQRAYRTIEDAKSDRKIYEEVNKEHIRTQQKEYCKNRPEQIKISSKKSYEKNKESRQERNNQWKEDNKERLAEYRKQKITCEICKCQVKIYGIAEHKRSTKHIKNVAKV